MRIPALAILTTVTVLTAAPALAQTYSPDYPVCLQAYRWGEATSIAAIPRWRSAPCQHRAAVPSASSIHILRERKRPGDHIIGGIVASTKYHLAAAGPVSLSGIGLALRRHRVLPCVLSCVLSWAVW
jgi:hypothetical protein